MPTDKPRISIVVTEELLREIDEFRYANRIKNQTQTIVTLINRGFEAISGKFEEPPKFSNDELQLIDEYRAAPKNIQEAAHNILSPYLERIEKNRA